MTNMETLNKALDEVKKSQTNFVNGDGKDNQDSIHSQALGNENGSISRTSSADGKGNDPVDSSDSTKKNPVGQEGKGVHSPGTRTHSAHSVKDPVNTSGDGHADDPENKSVNTKDYTKDKNGVRQPDTQQHGSTRKLSDKPNGNAQEEDHALNHSAGTKHNDADLTASLNKLIDVSKSLIHAVNVNAGNINTLKSEHMGILNTVNQLQKSLNAPAIKKNTVDKSTAVEHMTGADDKHQGNNEEKHMAPANVRGMFYHAEHSKGKKHTKQMADAENAVTRCHNSHKSLTDDQWADIETNAAINAAKSIINQVNDENIAKSLDSKLVHDAQTGNKAALGRDNYKYDQSEKSAHAKKSVDTGSSSAPTNSEATKSLSLANCTSMLASAKKAGNDSLVSKCSSMCDAMKKGKAAKSEAATLFKNINNVDHNSSANVSNMSANSSQKPTSKSDDIDHSTKSESASSNETTKSMPHGKAYSATMNNKNKSTSLHKSIVNPTIIRNRAKLYKSVILNKANHMVGSEPIVNKSLNMINKGVKENDPQYLQKSITNFNSYTK